MGEYVKLDFFFSHPKELLFFADEAYHTRYYHSLDDIIHLFMICFPTIYPERV